jgi:hypothetical protein
MTPAPRHLRARVLEALERRAKQFRSREELWPVRVPREPVALQEVIELALPDDHRHFDPITLRSRTLLHLEWGQQTSAERSRSPEAAWDAWVIVLPSGVKMYCDSDEDETRVLASGGRNAGDETDRAFLQLLAESAGQHFGIEMSGGAPSRVRCSIDDRDFLVELFVNLFEVTATEDSVRRGLADREGPQPSHADSQGTDFRSDVERWLEHVLR